MFDRRGALVLIAAGFAAACSGAVVGAGESEDQAASTTPAPASVSGTTPGAPSSMSPSSAAPSAPVQPRGAPQSVAPQPMVTPQPVTAPATPVTPQPVAAAPQPVAMAMATQPVMPSASAAAPADGAAGASSSSAEFDAGAGTMQPDGKTVVFHIADGTGSKDWNSMDMPIRVRRGMTLHLIDDDTTKAHQLHTLGQPCSHGSRPIGTGYDCVIRDNATLGISNGAYDHNAVGGRGRIYVDVVE